jgi:hypothetical protein
MPRREKNHAELTVRVSFETTRLGTQCLVEAYERLAPGRRRVLRADSNTAALIDEVRTRRDQGGKHA